MPFMLGSFTNGLFGSMKAMAEITGDWEKNKQARLETKRQQDLIDAAKAVRDASAVTPAAGGGVTPQVTSAKPDSIEPLGANDVGAAGEYGAGQPVAPSDLSSVVPPPRSIRASPDNPNEGRGGNRTALGGAITTPAKQPLSATNPAVYVGDQTGPIYADMPVDSGAAAAPVASGANTPGSQIRRALDFIASPLAPKGPGSGRAYTPHAAPAQALPLLAPAIDTYRAQPENYMAPTVVPPAAPPVGYPAPPTATPTGQPTSAANGPSNLGLGAQILRALGSAPVGY